MIGSTSQVVHAASFAYGAPAIARTDVHELRAAEFSLNLFDDALDGSAALSTQGSGTITTASALSNATKAAGAKLPGNAAQTLKTIEQTGAAPAGYKGGSAFANDGRAAGQVLPKSGPGGGPITYKEWDVNPYTKGVNRGAERLVTGSDGSVWYTSDHYTTFTKVN